MYVPVHRMWQISMYQQPAYNILLKITAQIHLYFMQEQMYYWHNNNYTLITHNKFIQENHYVLYFILVFNIIFRLDAFASSDNIYLFILILLTNTYVGLIRVKMKFDSMSSLSILRTFGLDEERLHAIKHHFCSQLHIYDFGLGYFLNFYVNTICSTLNAGRMVIL